MSFLAELRRRNVIRMVALYLVVAWLLVQIAAVLLPVFGAPDWVMKTLVGVLALGFVPAMVFSWVYELTPEGLKRDADVPLEQSIGSHTGRRMDRLIVVGLVAVVALVAADRFWPREEERGSESRSGRGDPDRAGAVVPESDSDPLSSSSRRIAVLPFVNLSADPEQEYFSDGITEEILNGLARIEAFTVTSRTSSFHFKGKDQPLPEIAKALGVDYVLEGSVRKAGEQVRVTAQLIKVDGDAHLWSDTWTRGLADIFAVQEEIARNVAKELEARLTDRDESRLSRAGTHDANAYQQFLRGRHLWNQRSVASLHAAIDAFKVAVAADPDYADAWAGLAQTYALLPEYEDNLPPAERLPGDAIAQTLDAAGKALALDPASSRALTARAYVRVMQEFDWAGGEADYRAAIAIDPSDATTRQWYGELLMYQRRWDESAVQYDAAIALDPLAPIIHYSRAISLLLKGDSAASLPYYEEGGRLLPDFDYGSPYRAKALVDLRRFDEATAAIRGVPDDDRLALQALIDATRDPARTDESVRLILAHGRETIVGKAFLLATLGRDEQALAELERLFAGKDPYRVFLYCTKAFDPLHADPRFQALLRQINLPAGNERPAPP